MDTQLEQRILSLLSTSEVDPITRLPKPNGKLRDPMKTLDIAKELLGETAKAKDVNPTLYSLLKRKMVIKTDTNGKDPHWTINPQGSMNNQSQLEKESKNEDETGPDSMDLLPEDEAKRQILEYLQTESEPIKTLMIAKKLYGSKGRRKHVNSILYSMLSKGLVSKSANPDNTDPRWIMNQKQPEPTRETQRTQLSLKVV